MKIIITGATGFIGRELCQHLINQNHQVTAIVRRPGSETIAGVHSVVWNVDSNSIADLANTIKNFDVVINLAGEPIAQKRWNDSIKKQLVESRLKITQAIVKAIKSLPSQEQPKQLISASAIGIYGDRANEILNEKSKLANDFLADLTQRWEQLANQAHSATTKISIIRIGIVLGKNGGALSKMLPSVLGDGKQWMSWIHIADVVASIAHIINQQQSGVFNLTAPTPVTNLEFTKTLVKVKYPIQLPATPKFLLNIVLGEMAQIVLASANVIPQNLINSRYQFQYNDLESALKNIFAN